MEDVLWRGKGETMKRTIGALIVVGIMLAGLAAFAQSSLDVFPVGTTTMRYTVTSEDISEPQTLELSVASLGDDQYTIRMSTEQTGTEDELATGFGFIFGGASVSSGGGHDVSYSSLQTLMDQRSRLKEGQDYLLPGGGTFENIEGVTIAGVWCLQGTYVNTDDTSSRMIVAFALSDPVYISPRIVAEELRDGEWVETFRLELVDYAFTEGDG
jgi:hypothetical protein